MLQGLAGLYCATTYVPLYGNGWGLGGGGGGHAGIIFCSTLLGGVGGGGGGPLNPAQHDRVWPLGFWVSGSVFGILAGFGLRSRVRFRDTT